MKLYIYTYNSLIVKKEHLSVSSIEVIEKDKTYATSGRPRPIYKNVINKNETGVVCDRSEPSLILGHRDDEYARSAFKDYFQVKIDAFEKGIAELKKKIEICGEDIVECQ